MYVRVCVCENVCVCVFVEVGHHHTHPRGPIAENRWISHIVIHKSACTRKYAQLITYLSSWTWVCVGVCVRVCVCVSMCARMSVCIDICNYVRVSVYVCMYDDGLMAMLTPTWIQPTTKKRDKRMSVIWNHHIQENKHDYINSKNSNNLINHEHTDTQTVSQTSTWHRRSIGAAKATMTKKKTKQTRKKEKKNKSQGKRTDESRCTSRLWCGELVWNRHASCIWKR